MLSVGRGIADITGEAADCGMLGYGKSDQRTAGIHQRLRSRAFVFRDDSQDGDARLLLIVAELPLPMQNVNEEVLRRLADLYGDTYSEQNTLITATHTHAGPGGYCGYLLYNLTTSGFRPATFAAIVDGIVESVEHAHADVAPAEVSLSHGELYGASINRSPSAFDRNPPADKAFFPKRVDPHTTLVRIDRGEATVGVIHFFATHGTSMTNRNHLISGDNKGFAAYHWERTVGGADYLAGQPDFIAAFAQTNPGDMSPNVDGPLSPEAPPDREFDNTRRTGLCQFEDAFTQLSGATPIGAGIDARFTYVDLGSVLVRAAQAPKGIVMPARLPNRIHPFVQEIVPVQLVRIGRLYLIGIPGEPTIVAGLRLRRMVASIVGADLADVLCVGYTNAYIHYVTTPEEYLEQRYEGGSTLFGRWELCALMQTVAELAEAMRDGRPVTLGRRPRPTRELSWVRGAPADAGSFGAVIAEPSATYRPGQAVEAVFVSALPNNDLRRGGTYLEVVRREGASWVRIADDGDWATSFRWQRQGRAGSHVSIRWDVPGDTTPGQYRIVHHGTARDRNGMLTAFSATTREFTVV